MDSTLLEQVRDARHALLSLIADLDDAQMTVPYLPTINPPLWEACHAAYFHELWVLRRGAGEQSALPDSDALFDSATIAHEERWRLPMPSRAIALDYLRGVAERVAAVLEREGDTEVEVAGQGGEGRYRVPLSYLGRYAVMHEDMHAEALTYLRQTLGYPPPRGVLAERATRPLRDAEVARGERAGESPAPAGGDAEIPGGDHWLGAPDDGRFAFDNERPIHRVTIAPFRMSRTAVTEGEFEAFVEDAGYERRELWSPEGWAWRQAANAEAPLFWRLRADPSGPHRHVRHFDQWRRLEADRAMMHINWYEADAYSRWAKRRLPTEAEWEYAATGPCDHGVSAKPRFPWGDAPSTADHLNADWCAMGPVDVRAHAAGDSPFGIRQMLGNVWEWTSTTFGPFEGFHPDMYRDYSRTSFQTRKVLRGGCCYSRARMLWTSWRNYYQPFRRDVFAGFRTCALD